MRDAVGVFIAHHWKSVFACNDGEIEDLSGKDKIYWRSCLGRRECAGALRLTIGSNGGDGGSGRATSSDTLLVKRPGVSCERCGVHIGQAAAIANKSIGAQRSSEVPAGAAQRAGECAACQW